MSLEPLHRPDWLAELIGKPESTLAQWRYLGKGPRYIKLEGGGIRYRESDVASWLDAQTVTTVEANPS